MATLMGLLGIEDRTASIDSVGQREVFDAINQVADRHTAEVAEMTRAFVQEQTTQYKEIYHLAGGGMMQDADEKGAQPGVVKSAGQWDVAYDLRDARDAIGWDDVAVAYMTVGELDRHIETITIRHTNWVRFHLLRHLLNSTNEVFRDKIRGQLTIKRLANGDTDPFPPLIGGDGDDITGHNHYIGTAYAGSAISSVNNPIPVIKEHLEEHFDTGTPVFLINPAQEAVFRALPGFVARTNENVNPGSNTDTLQTGGFDSVPGILQGTLNDVAIFTWRRMPANYGFAWDLDVDAPLKERVDDDMAASLRGFKLVSEQTDFPLTKSQWRDRRGYGVANRLNGVAVHFSGDGNYTTPAAFA